jgi:UDP-N-acetylmuramoyl-tripeptide--D-alanyl-D-alanine ligase
LLYNALAATAVGLALGLRPAETAAALREFRPLARRSQVVTLPHGVHLLNDCYNANPGSMAMALKTLAELRDRGRTAAALGDMLELGATAAQEHRKIGRLAAQSGVDYLVVYGNFRLEVAAGAREGGLAAARIFPIAQLADGARVLEELLAPGDWLLVKGSRSMHMEGLVDLLKES